VVGQELKVGIKNIQNRMSEMKGDGKKKDESVHKLLDEIKE
jgi:hypothetical protein